ncbi:MAG: hypothetical protein Tsb0015_05790 [Simkaniaceae bacterium]
MAFLSEEVKEKFRKLFFPLSGENLGLFSFFWLFLGFSIGLSTLFGPIRWISDFFKAREVDYFIENRIVRILIVLYVVITALIAAWFVRFWRKPRQKLHVKIFIILFVLASGLSSFLFMIFPSYFGEVREINIKQGEVITFGPYPNKEQLKKLKENNYTTVIALMDPGILPERILLDRERAEAKEVGIELVHIPMIPWVGEATNRQAEKQLLEIFGQQPLTGRYYIHCYLGEDRVFIAKKMIQRLLPGILEVQLSTSYALERTRDFYNGKIIQLGSEAFVVPNPTKEEIFTYLGKMPLITTILDPAFYREKGNIEEEQKIFQSFGVPYRVFPIPPIHIDPSTVLEAVKEMKKLPPPFVVQTLDTTSPRSEIFIQTYFYGRPALASSDFKYPLQRGKAFFYLFNTLLGPRPAREEFSLLYDRSVRNILFLGGPDTEETKADKQYAMSAGIDFQTFNQKGSWRSILDKGGPWYVYGPRLTRNQLAFLPELENGKTEELIPGVYLMPEIKEGEMKKFFSSSQIQKVFFLLEEDAKYLRSQELVLSKLRIPFFTKQMAKTPFHPEEMLLFSKNVWHAPKPAAVIIPQKDAYLREAFKQAFFTSKPPLPPSLLNRKDAEVLAVNVAAGARPSEKELVEYLPQKGIKGFIYLGYPDSPEALEDKKILEKKNQASWQSLDPELNSFYEYIFNGGPWYLYGPALTMNVIHKVSGKIGPAVPSQVYYYPLKEREKKTKIHLENYISLKEVITGRLSFWEIFPKPSTLVLVVPVFVLYGVFWAAYAGRRKIKKNTDTPYTRKIFHFAIFFAAGIIQLVGGFPLVSVFAIIIVGMVLYALCRGSGFPFYEAMARPSDAPHRTSFVILPLFMTALGGLLNNIFFGELAVIGIFVAGFGDAIAEVVGRRWGKHSFPVPSIMGVRCRKTVEGSLSIALTSALVAAWTLWYLGLPFIPAVNFGLIIGAVAMVVEVISFHGLDNLTVQMATAAAAYYLLKGFGYL